MPQISLRDVSVRVNNPETRVILGPITLTIDQPRIGIIGANGSGKSTFARLINGLNIATEGTVSVDGLDVAKDAKKVRRKVGFIFSDADNQIIMPTVREDIALSLRRFKLPKDEVHSRVDSVMERLGISHLAQASPHTLSGGEKQLLALASVVVMEPDIIIADEPTTLLDLINRRRVVAALDNLQQQLIVVTHDLDIVRDFDRVLWFNDAKIHADSLDSSPKEIIDDYIAHCESTGSDYTR